MIQEIFIIYPISNFLFVYDFILDFFLKNRYIYIYINDINKRLVNGTFTVD